MLRPVPRVVNEITTRLPHPDIGFYNLLDADHRRYMRIMADRFGVYGFCYYHYWFKNKPVMHKVLELLLEGGEPNKPFFLAWANEPWSRRWDGRDSEVLLQQDYSDIDGNIQHFKFLLRFFKHPNYIRINDMPVFAMYRIDPKDIDRIEAIMEMWLQLAKNAGLKGIYFLRFMSAFKNKVHIHALSGQLQFEPVHSWVNTGGGPSIFLDNKFNDTIYLANNPELITEKRASAQYHREKIMRSKYRTSQFKVHDKFMTWNAIEGKHFHDISTFRGSFCHWSNVPRRNFTNGDYVNYPHMMSPDSLKGCREHLERMAHIVINEPTPVEKEKFLFLTAWNEWNEQSVFEPTDVDGYDALVAVKSAVRGSTGKKVNHISHRGGGTGKYIYDLIALFGEYEHVFRPWELPVPDSLTALLHIHSAMVGERAVKWGILDYIKQNKIMGIRVYVTIHDYQWFFPDDPYPTLEVLQQLNPNTTEKENTKKLLELADMVIFPSKALWKSYLTFVYGKNYVPENGNNFVVVGHNDILVKNERLNVPLVRNNEVNIAFVGTFLPYKGSDMFKSMAKKMLNVYFAIEPGTEIRLRFHVFGVAQKNENCKAKYCSPESAEERKLGITYHGYYTDEALPSLLDKANIHILMFLSTFLEPYCYALSTAINTGLAIVYLNRGALIERLDYNKYERYFPISEPDDIVTAVSKAVRFVLSRHGTKLNFYNISSNVQPTKWYISNYPEPSPQ